MHRAFGRRCTSLDLCHNKGSANPNGRLVDRILECKRGPAIVYRADVGTRGEVNLGQIAYEMGSGSIARRLR